ncbi:MAG: hypothetical protein H6704_10380 [Myxococcales bacterium]|nr:hypothetical protein [Myxococcales bacterium]
MKAFSARWRAPDGPVAHPPACEAQWAATLDQFTGAVPADDALVWLETVYGRAAPRGPACGDAPPANARAAAWPAYAARWRVLCDAWLAEQRRGAPDDFAAKARAEAAVGRMPVALGLVLRAGDSAATRARQAAFLDEVLPAWLPALADPAHLERIEPLRALAPVRWHAPLDAARCAGARARLDRTLARPAGWTSEGAHQAIRLDPHLAVCPSSDGRRALADRLAHDVRVSLAAESDPVARQERAVEIARTLPADGPVGAPAREALAPLLAARTARLDALRTARAQQVRGSAGRGAALERRGARPGDGLPPDQIERLQREVDLPTLHAALRARYLTAGLGAGQRRLRHDLLAAVGVDAGAAPNASIELALGPACAPWAPSLEARLRRVARPGVALRVQADDCAALATTATVATGRSITVQRGGDTVCVEMDQNRNCLRHQVRLSNEKVALAEDVESVSVSLSGTLTVRGLDGTETLPLRFGRPPPASVRTRIPSSLEVGRAAAAALRATDAAERSAVARVGARHDDPTAWLAAAQAAATAADREDRAALAALTGAALPPGVIRDVAVELGVPPEGLPRWFRGEK